MGALGAGALYHITSRGNERKKIFLDDGDRKKFLGILEECDGIVMKDCLKH
jgi:REP element-mobilizing transposase RayT